MSEVETITAHSSLRPFSKHLNISFELLICVITVVPILILIYWYTVLPDQIPAFRNLRGEVVFWARKSFLSVFRLPAMGIVLQLLCLLMKYSLLQSKVTLPAENADRYLSYRQESIAINMKLWDWIRFLVAFKQIGASLIIVFLSFERFRSLATAYTIVSLLVTVLAAGGALLCGYRLLTVKRKMKKIFGSSYPHRQVDAAYIYGGVVYYNSADPSLFVRKYMLNFANKWSYVFIVCLIAYPLLVFMPAILK